MLIKETTLVKNILDLLERDFPGCELHFLQYSIDDTKRKSLIDIRDVHNLSDKVHNLLPGGKFHLPIKKNGDNDTSYISYSYKAYIYQNRLMKIDYITQR